MSTPDALLNLLPDELYKRLLDANGCTGEPSHELKIELADVSATLQLDKRRVRKKWSDATKEVVRQWLAENDQTNRRPGSLTNAERQKKHRKKMQVLARKNATDQAKDQLETVARLKETLGKYCKGSIKTHGGNQSKSYGLAVMDMMPSAHFMVVRKFIELVEGQDRDGWHPETNEAFVRYSKKQWDEAHRANLEEDITQVNLRDLGR